LAKAATAASKSAASSAGIGSISTLKTAAPKTAVELTGKTVASQVAQASAGSKAIKIGNRVSVIPVDSQGYVKVSDLKSVDAALYKRLSESSAYKSGKIKYNTLINLRTCGQAIDSTPMPAVPVADSITSRLTGSEPSNVGQVVGSNTIQEAVAKAATVASQSVASSAGIGSIASPAKTPSTGVSVLSQLKTAISAAKSPSVQAAAAAAGIKAIVPQKSGTFFFGGKSYTVPMDSGNNVTITDLKTTNPSLATMLEPYAKDGKISLKDLASLSGQKMKTQAVTESSALDSLKQKDSPAGTLVGSVPTLPSNIQVDSALGSVLTPGSAQGATYASGAILSGFNMALSSPATISGVLGPATSGHPADNAYPLGNAEDGGWLDCGAIMPTTFEWTMPAGKIPGGYVDAFGAVMSRADYITKYNVDPEYALWYMRSNQAAKDLKAQQQSYSQPYVATPLAQTITPMSQIMAGVSPVSAGSYSYSGGGGSYSGGSGVQVWTEEPGLPVAPPSTPETTKPVTEEDLEDMSLDQLATLYLSNFTVSGDVSKVDLKKLKTDDPDFYNDLLQSKAIAAADTSVSLVKAVNAWVTANTPKPVTTTEPETPTPTEPTTTTEDTSDLTLEEATVLYLSQFTQSSNAARIDTAKLLNGDPQMYNDLIKAGIITTASMSVPLLTAANAWVAYATKAGSTVAPVYTSPVAQQPVTPVVEVPAKKMLQVSFKKYNIPDAGIKLTKILDDVPELIADRSRRQSFTKVLTSIAGSDGVLDMDEMSRLNSISGVPIRLV